MNDNINTHTNYPDSNIKLEIPAINITPLKKICMTIGELPASYLETMSYYEMLLWFIQFLQNTVIPTVNNNSDALQEVQTVVLELQQYINNYKDVIDSDVEDLENYMNNYFDNLDVQDEINNKLDQMVLDGTLQEIITSYLNAKALFIFDTVNDMKEATNLIDGSYCGTLGFYQVNDLGGATYKIRTIEQNETPDEITVLSLYDNSLCAEIVYNDKMNVKQFGAKGDEETDDTTIIQTALTNCKNIFIPTGTYMIDAKTSLYPSSNSKIELSNDAILEAITNDADHYEIINIHGVNNVEISGGTIKGERSTHIGNSGEWGQCISINTSSSDIFIHDINLIDAWGDGIYINTATNIRTQNVHVDNTRRNGYSLVAVQNFSSNNDVIENVDGTNPKAGVDIEPNTPANILKNIVFNHLTTKNNGSIGFSIALNTANSDIIDITVNDLYTEGEKRAIVVNASENSLSHIKFNNPYLRNSTGNGVLANVLYSGNTLELNKIIVDGYNTSESTYTGIAIIPESNKTSGRVLIKEPTIIHEGSGSNGSISFTTRGSSYPSHNCSIINPIYIEGDVILDQNSVDLSLSDIYGALTRDSDANITIKNTYRSVYTSSSYTADRRLTIAQNTTPINDIITFRNTGDHKMTLRFTDQYIYPLSSAISKDIELTEKGSSLTIKKISSTEWIVTDVVGTPTVVS